MTIIEPSKNKFRIDFLTALLGTAVLLSVFLAVFFYNSIINLRQDLKNQESRRERLQSQNIELRNRLYAILDSETLIQKALSAGLVAEKKPTYLPVGEEPAISEDQKLANQL